jgi:tRNA-specific 2-thiouridylase
LPGPEKTVLLGMSGGVDSSLAAALLQQQGWRVLGLTLRLLPCPDEGSGESCCGLGAEVSASATAARLGIEHRVMDCRAEFLELVLRPAWEEYRRGRTPNPCLWCNSRIRFPKLAEMADRFGCHYIATGHYARVGEGSVKLLRGRDAHKDQAYFLFAVAREILARAVFPLGEITKSETRRQARALALPAAERPESQDACLSLPGVPFAELLRRRFAATAQPGELVDLNGRVLGKHPGLHLYTIGQRRGLGLARGKPLYVVELDEKSNRLVVGEAGDLLRRELRADRACWLGEPAPGHYQVQIRYRHRPAEAWLEPLGEEAFRLRFDAPQRAITPGQAAVIYRGEELVGGGWISSSC